MTSARMATSLLAPAGGVLTKRNTVSRPGNVRVAGHKPLQRIGLATIHGAAMFPRGNVSA